MEKNENYSHKEGINLPATMTNTQRDTWLKSVYLKNKWGNSVKQPINKGLDKSQETKNKLNYSEK